MRLQCPELFDCVFCGTQGCPVFLDRRQGQDVPDSSFFDSFLLPKQVPCEVVFMCSLLNYDDGCLSAIGPVRNSAVVTLIYPPAEGFTVCVVGLVGVVDDDSPAE